MHSYYDCITFLLAKASQRSVNRLKKALSQYDLTTAQALFLECIAVNNGIPASEIGKKLSFDHATVSGVLDRLEDTKWISKEIDTEDRRISRIFLTQKAKEKIPELLKTRRLVNEDTLKSFSQEEKILIKRLLREIINSPV